MPPDEEAIAWRCERLIRRAVMLSDLGRWQELAELYTEDARMSRPSDPGRWIVGRAAILESFLARPPRTNRHLIGNIVVEVISEREARALTTVALFSGPAASDGERVRTEGPLLIGAFNDLLRCEAGFWRFASRTGSLALEHGDS
jgi:hypothetical protein